MTDILQQEAPLEALQSPYKTVQEAANFLRLSPQTLNNMRSSGKGPSYHKHGRRILYHIDELTSWSMTLKVTVPPMIHEFQ